MTAYDLAHDRVLDRLFLDYETYCELDVTDVGAYRLVEHPSFFPLMAAYALNDDEVRVAVGVDQIVRIPGLFDDAVVKVAHNAAFERLVTSWLAWERGTLDRYTYLPPEPWHDTMAIAAELGLPQSLDGLARALGTPHKVAGKLLINWFCKPDRKGQRRMPDQHPEKWKEFREYCRMDVVVTRAVHKRMGGWNTATERDVYLTDQAINDRGMAIDVELAAAARTAAEDNRMYQELEVSALTGNVVLNPGSRNQLHNWLVESGLDIPNLRAETVEAWLGRDDLTDVQRRVLELRQELALSASAKFETALGMACRDGRLRGLYRFFGAHTGRWAGRGVQPHNLPREQLATEEETEAAILDLKLYGEASAPVLKALVRALFTGPMTVVDYAAIEARVIAWLAGEEWALEAFEAGRDIYVETAERMSSPTKTFDRRDGKIAVLALGYSGGVNSMRSMGAEGTDEELGQIVASWRGTNSRIASLWGEIEWAFREAEKGKRVRVGEHLSVSHKGGVTRLWLPSGRALSYHNVKWADREDDINGDHFIPGSPARKWTSPTFIDPRKGIRVRTYGGRLAENATQAVARDILAEALVRLEQRGYPVVGHVHDEILVEGEHTVSEVAAVMSEPPPWAEGLPISGEGFVARRYRKG